MREGRAAWDKQIPTRAHIAQPAQAPVTDLAEKMGIILAQKDNRTGV